MQRRMHRSLDERLGTPPKSPFIRPHLNGEPSSLSKKRTLSLNSNSARIWALIFAFGVIYTIHKIFHPSSSVSHSFYNQDALHPVNYLNISAQAPPPFAFCPSHGPGDVVGNKYGAHIMARSRLHLGSGARVQRLIHKAMSGQPVTISILGGSIASCHGAGNDPLAGNCWPARFFMWWNSVFPHPATQLTNGARRRTDTSYFAFCHSHHLPDEADLVILDFDTEDHTELQALDHFELLVRSLLNRRDSPAILVLGHFSPQYQTQYGFVGPEHQHSIVAQFYDLPHISLKNTMYHQYLYDPDQYRHDFHIDPVLANENGHEALSDMLIGYFQTQVCKSWDAAVGVAFDIPMLSSDQGGKANDAKGLFGGIRAGDGGLLNGAMNEDGNKKGMPGGNFGAFRVPAGKLDSRPWDLVKFTEADPFCVAADDLINPLPPSLFYGSGWHVYHPENGPGGDDVRHYWYSILPTSKLRVPIKVGAGDIAVYYLQEDSKQNGVECWVDDNYSGRVRISNEGAQSTQPKLVMIDHGVSTGPHYVECQLLGEDGQQIEAFKLLGIFAT